ncbi:MAG TPA: trypsin-like peptidase domain-containing protein [Actinomycetota bacterium]|nr:trypsin-like peptidase domain-containing protein [Actinomycetota bacterium]
MRKIVLGVVALAFVATACSVGVGARGASTADTLNSTTLPAAGGGSVAAVVKRVLPAVVNVTTDVFQTDQFGNAQQGKGVGTGFIVRSDGIVVTNCHVVEGASKITVFTSDAKPKQYDARVIGGDCQHDLAVLKVDATNLPTVPLGTSNALVLGQPVVAIGYALALEGGPTVTSGIVSSLDRTIDVQDPGCTVCKNGARVYSDVIQTDAAINHGNSGGPLVNMAGQVVGINSAGDDSAQNIGFAIAIDSAKETIAQAMAEPLAPSPYLGVTTQGVTADLAYQLGLGTDSGVYVIATTGDGPAAKAGIQQGDVITAIDGHAVASSQALGSLLDGLKPNQTVGVTVITPSGSQRSIEVTLGTRPLPTQLP